MSQAHTGDWIRLQRPPGFPRLPHRMTRLDGHVIGQMLCVPLRRLVSTLRRVCHNRFGIGPVPVIQNMNCRQSVLRGRDIFVQFQRLERAGLGFGERDRCKGPARTVLDKNMPGKGSREPERNWRSIAIACL